MSHSNAGKIIIIIGSILSLYYTTIQPNDRFSWTFIYCYVTDRYLISVKVCV